MKVSNPISRSRLKLPCKFRVLEVGSGHNPNFRSNVLAEKFIDSNYHRSDDVKVYPHQEIINADGQRLPFKDKEFDFVISCHVMEHVEDPKAFVAELSRVAPAGYLEVPSFIGEALCPKESHKWVSLEIDGKIVMYDKALMPRFFPDFGRTFINFLPFDNFALRVFFYSTHQAESVRYRWKDSIEVVVNPEDEYYKSFFTKQWTNEMVRVIFPARSGGATFRLLWSATWCLMMEKLGRVFHPGRAPLPLDEYFKLKGK